MTAILGRITPLLNKIIPAGLALKGISKISPRLANFATDSLSAGYGADQILDYLRDRVGSEGDLSESKRLQANGLTPTEKKAAGKRKQQEVGKTIASTAIGLASGIGGLPTEQKAAQAIKGEVLPAINNMIKPNPVTLNGNMRIGNEQAKQITNKERLGIPQMQKPPQAKNPPSHPKNYEQENMFQHIQQQLEQKNPIQGNIIQQISPQLHSFIQSEIQTGRDPNVIAFRALEKKGFKKIIERIENKAGENIEDLISNIYGEGQPQSKAALQSQSAPQQNQSSAATQALIQALTNATEARKRRAGGG